MPTLGHVHSFCINCDKEVREALFTTASLLNLLTMVSGFLILGALVRALSCFATRNYRRHSSRFPDKAFLNPVPLTVSSTVLGIGIGGFIDGIFLHQILQ